MTCSLFLIWNMWNSFLYSHCSQPSRPRALRDNGGSFLNSHSLVIGEVDSDGYWWAYFFTFQNRTEWCSLGMSDCIWQGNLLCMKAQWLTFCIQKKIWPLQPLWRKNSNSNNIMTWFRWSPTPFFRSVITKYIVILQHIRFSFIYGMTQSHSFR